MAESTSVDASTDGCTASQIAEVGTHLMSALVVMDRLLADARTGSSERSLYHHLGEASRAVHHALLALNECSEVTKRSPEYRALDGGYSSMISRISGYMSSCNSSSCR